MQNFDPRAIYCKSNIAYWQVKSDQCFNMVELFIYLMLPLEAKKQIIYFLYVPAKIVARITYVGF